jgi:hypothetical protein
MSENGSKSDLPKSGYSSFFFLFFFLIFIWFMFDTLIVHLETILNASILNTEFCYKLVHASFL